MGHTVVAEAGGVSTPTATRPVTAIASSVNTDATRRLALTPVLTGPFFRSTRASTCSYQSS